MALSERWQQRVTEVVDKAHAEDWGGKHRSGFCEACADAHLVAQHAVPDAGVVSPAWLTSNETFEIAYRGARSCGVGRMSPTQLTAALSALSAHLEGK